LLPAARIVETIVWCQHGQYPSACILFTWLSHITCHNPNSCGHLAQKVTIPHGRHERPRDVQQALMIKS
jgi:hypothetical protein